MAPNDIVYWNMDVDNSLIPETTFDYKKQFTQTNFDFPNLHIDNPELFYNPIYPASTYAHDMNLRTAQRYNFRSS
jgi:hypothetical protein